MEIWLCFSLTFELEDYKHDRLDHSHSSSYSYCHPEKIIQGFIDQKKFKKIQNLPTYWDSSFYIAVDNNSSSEVSSNIFLKGGVE